MVKAIVLRKNIIHKVINPIILLLCSYLAIQASNATLNGCDFIQLQFKLRRTITSISSIRNDRNIRSMGLGLRYHDQPLTTSDDHDEEVDGSSKCLPYDTNLASEIFHLQTELDATEFCFTLSHWITMTMMAIIGLNFISSYFIPLFINDIILLSCSAFILISAIIQSYGHNLISRPDSTICDRDQYSIDSSSSTSSSSKTRWIFDDGDESDFFFVKCQFGQAESSARISRLYQLIAHLGVIIVLACEIGWDSFFENKSSQAGGRQFDNSEKNCLRSLLYRENSSDRLMGMIGVEDDGMTEASYGDEKSEFDDGSDDEEKM